MLSPEIIDYIKNERQRKTDDSVIKTNLISNGWKVSDVLEAFSSIDSDKVLVSVLNDEEIKKDRTNKKWLIFCILLVIDFFLIMFFYLLGDYSSRDFSIPLVILRLIIIYAISAFAVMGYVPSSNNIDILKIILKVIILIVITFAIIFVYDILTFKFEGVL